MAFLQAFVDDSSSDTGDQRLFMAGYLNQAEKWALFADAWHDELRTKPSIDYLKMAEAQNRRGQFKGWSEEDRDEKLRGLARIIRHFAPFSFEFSISRERFYHHVKPVSPRGLGNPHFTCCFGIVASVARYAASQKGGLPIDFIFDEQEGVSADVQLFFEYMKRSLPKSAQALINGVPIFRNDKQFAQLQAADMLVWHLRREHEARASPEPLPLLDWLRIPDRHLMSEIDEPILKSWADHHSKLPAINQLKSKGQWQNIKAEIARLSSLGIDPSTVGPRKSILQRVREGVARLFRA